MTTEQQLLLAYFIVVTITVILLISVINLYHELSKVNVRISKLSSDKENLKDRFDRFKERVVDYIPVVGDRDLEDVLETQYDWMGNTLSTTLTLEQTKKMRAKLRELEELRTKVDNTPKV